MKNGTHVCILLVLASTICFWSCKRSPQKTEVIDADQFYKGEIIGKDCPSFGFIKIIGDEIGDKWTYDKTYANVIGITNCPDSLTKGTIISFRIKTTGNPRDCLPMRPCHAVITVPDYPDKMYCASDILVAK